MNPWKFFGVQFLCMILWVLTFGSVAIVITHGEDLMMVLQGWGREEPFVIHL